MAGISRLVVCAPGQEQAVIAWAARTGIQTSTVRVATSWTGMLGLLNAEVLFWKGWGTGREQPEIDRMLEHARWMEDQRQARLDPFTPRALAQPLLDEPRKRALDGTA